jgi:hypothetical protein
VRTVRSAARARNRPRKRLAWILLAILGLLVALAARVNAAASDDAVELARRYADVLTGEDCADEDSAARASAEPPAGGDDRKNNDDNDNDDNDDNDDDDCDAVRGTRRAGSGRADGADVRLDRVIYQSAAEAAGRARPADIDDDEPEARVSPGAMASWDADAATAAAAVTDGEGDVDGMDGAGTDDPGAREPTRWPTAERLAAGAGVPAADGAGRDDATLSPLGRPASRRLDLGLTWRTRASVPRSTAANRLQEVWLFATWRL